MKIGCAVLAGGKSSRMGTGFEEKMIARGNRSDIEDVSWDIVPDIYPERGPIGGLHAVLSICKSEAIFCVSCDTPMLQMSLVKDICNCMGEEVDAVIAVTEDGRKHPLCGIYRKSVLPVLEEQILMGNNRMMAVLNRVRVEYVKIDYRNSQQLKNINTPKDYLAIK